MAVTALTNARLVLPDAVMEGSVVFEDGTIVAAGPSVVAPVGAETIDAGGLYVAPGFIDIHVHGGGGHSLVTDDPERIRAYARWVASRGVTSFLISTFGADHEGTLRNLRGSVAALRGPTGGARPLGFHLEGPFLNPKRKGAFPESALRPPDAQEFRAYAEAAGGAIRQVTLAPEMSGAHDLVRAVLDAGAVPAMGHTDATYEEARRAFDLGVCHVTHCYNAMRPLVHRDPGCLGAALTSDRVTCELICDGAHVHPAAADLLVRAKGVDRTVLVTDGMVLAGTGEGILEWDRGRIEVKGRAAVREDGTIVGSVATLDDLVRNAARWLPVSLPQAVRMATLNPARVIGAEGRGIIELGAAADLVLLDDDLRVVSTLVAGTVVYRRSLTA
ncbi:MAG: N-acetylglucosamine-6-phosphate deacetylase [Dehalococcoidia bacterium]